MIALDTILTVLGDLDREASRGHFQLQRPEVKILGNQSVVVETLKSSTPDLILLAGVLKESPTTQKNATLQMRLRRGQPFPGEPALTWSICGEKGEIRLFSSETAFLHIGEHSPAPFMLQIHDFDTNKVEKIEYDWEEWEKELNVQARGIGRLYEEFARVQNGGEQTLGYATFGEALDLHRTLEGLIAEWKA